MELKKFDQHLSSIKKSARKKIKLLKNYKFLLVININ